MVIIPGGRGLYAITRESQGVRLPTTDRDADDDDDDGIGADRHLPCSFSASIRTFTSFSSMSAVLSLSCVGRAVDHAWKSRMSSSSIELSSRTDMSAHTCMSDSI